MIDIIITTYNNPIKLDKALSSLYAQTSDQFKVTVVDDASSEDNSPLIDSWNSKLSLDYIRNRQNVGPGLSRQVGVDNTDCEYFLFLDSDDRLMPHAVQLIHDVISTNDCPDLIISPFYTQVFDIEAKLLKRPSSILISNDPSHIITWHHGKVYKRTAIEQYNIKVPEMYSYIGDDTFYNLLCVSLLDNQCVTSLPYYIWIQDRDSLTHTRNMSLKDKHTQIASALLAVAEYVTKYNKPIDNVLPLLKMACIADSEDSKIDDAVVTAIKSFIKKL